ncbi:hypothetical protein JA33_184 [Dickeya phage vB_DsoM_JA33]|uniref:Uncharacterized protein n=3 Tax=Salmondvirus JA11 TaxID=2734141 RepID=A0A384ZWI1_9CAUD|nr:hypothetical protein HOU32_gp184 [Dickeya phage vB_DsoM_JA11]AXG66587.1 hypothetical protein JA13_184 [Dickeya phage vB_DsoM_JA13]AXG67558.1 hypothetical protein JA33_184 [Dickeya phage vB_DsoM_JA33]AYD79989.1 hypothetical protein JA11_184 [Dickeya phage vB_DsoM_JA11]
MPVIAVTQQSPEQVFAWLRSQDPKVRVTYCPQGIALDPDKQYRKHIFVVGTKEFDRNAVSIRQMPQHIFFVFGHSTLLEKYGLEVDKPVQEIEPTRPRVVPVGSYLKDLKQRAIEGSLFYSLMTFIYTMPSKTHQKPITNTICKWIYSGCVTDIREEIEALELRISNSTMAKLISILEKPVTYRLRDAFIDLNNGTCMTMGQAVIKHRVQIFELGYIKGNVEKIANVTDELVANQGI